MRTQRWRALAAGVLVVGLAVAVEGCADRAIVGPGHAPGPSEIGPSETGPAARASIVAALEDERKSEDFYEAVMAAHGRRPPMMMLANQERCHQRWLHALAARHGVALPARAPNAFDFWASFEDACLAGAHAERENVALYDRLLLETADPDVRATFERLRWVSLERHLPALERAASGG